MIGKKKSLPSVNFDKTPMHKVFKGNWNTSWSSDKSYKGTLR